MLPKRYVSLWERTLTLNITGLCAYTDVTCVVVVSTGQGRAVLEAAVQGLTSMGTQYTTPVLLQPNTERCWKE